MTCKETRNFIGAYVDRELDPAGSLAVERHMDDCESCSREADNLRTLGPALASPALRFSAPVELRRRIEAELRNEASETKPREPSRKRSSRYSWLSWSWIPASTAVAAALLLVVVWNSPRWFQSPRDTELTQDIVSSHVRSMMANHITDVESSDSHTVKPWFGGKLDYSPPTRDLTDRGFRLIGGRLDYLDKRPVAAIVYQRSQHFINLFVWPSDSTVPEGRLTMQGYNVIHWTQSGMTYWLISELNFTELNECARLLREP